MRTRGFAALVCLAAAALAAGCGGSSSSSGGATTRPAKTSKAFVVLVTDINQLNDHGFNQLAYQGLLRAERELGIRGQVYQSPSSQAYIPNLSQAARKGADLVISVGFDQADAIAKVAPQYPKTRFAPASSRSAPARRTRSAPSAARSSRPSIATSLATRPARRRRIRRSRC
jgi:basic membrane protein A and related proteins